MLFIRLRVCVNDILVYELCIWKRFFSFLPRTSISRSLHWWSVAQTRKATCTMVLFGLVTMDKIYFCLFNKKPCEMLLSFLMYYMQNCLVKHNLHACISRMGATQNICILIIFRRGWQCKVGWERHITRITPYQPFRILLFISKWL